MSPRTSKTLALGQCEQVLCLSARAQLEAWLKTNTSLPREPSYSGLTRMSIFLKLLWQVRRRTALTQHLLEIGSNLPVTPTPKVPTIPLPATSHLLLLLATISKNGPLLSLKVSPVPHLVYRSPAQMESGTKLHSDNSESPLSTWVLEPPCGFALMLSLK